MICFGLLSSCRIPAPRLFRLQDEVAGVDRLAVFGQVDGPTTSSRRSMTCEVTATTPSTSAAALLVEPGERLGGGGKSANSWHPGIPSAGSRAGAGPGQERFLQSRAQVVRPAGGISMLTILPSSTSISAKLPMKPPSVGAHWCSGRRQGSGACPPRRASGAPPGGFEEALDAELRRLEVGSGRQELRSELGGRELARRSRARSRGVNVGLGLLSAAASAVTRSESFWSEDASSAPKASATFEPALARDSRPRGPRRCRRACRRSR